MGSLDSWRNWRVDGLWARGFGVSIGYDRHSDRLLRHTDADHDWSRCLAGTTGAVEMRPIVIAAVVPAASITGFQMYQDGKHIPTLDMPMTFIPR